MENKISKRVMLVEDDPEALTELMEIVEQAGFSGFPATDLPSALKIDAEEELALVVSDIRLLGRSGLDLLATLKNGNGRNCEVIMITGSGGTPEAIQALRSGAYDFLQKPIDVDHFLHTLERAWRHLNQIEATEAATAALADSVNTLKQTNEKLQGRNNLIRTLFGRYLDDEIIDHMIDTPEAAGLGGGMKKVAILISDLRGFTKLTEQVRPQQVVDMLNNYFTRMFDVIAQHGGAVDNIVGDSIIVTFGVISAEDPGAEDAVRCALSMQQTMRAVNDWNGRMNLPSLEMGIGIDYGDVIVGNIGSETRMNHSVIGQAVNRAARIESKAKGGQILVSDRALAAISHRYEFGSTRHEHVKGFSDPVAMTEINACLPG
jgi:class 3 adenylate cyclase